MKHPTVTIALPRVSRTVGWGFTPSRLVCAFCGTPFIPRRSGRPQRFCSPICQRLNWCREQLEQAGHAVRVEQGRDDAAVGAS